MLNARHTTRRVPFILLPPLVGPRWTITRGEGFRLRAPGSVFLVLRFPRCHRGGFDVLLAEPVAALFLACAAPCLGRSCLCLFVVFVFCCCCLFVGFCLWFVVGAFCPLGSFGPVGPFGSLVVFAFVCLCLSWCVFVRARLLWLVTTGVVIVVVF